jgi:hypothetical protein
MNMPHMRYVAFSYSEGITTRDNNKMVRLVTSQAYRDLWGDRFVMEKLGETKIENNQTGFKLATSVGGRGTGERGDRVILDDPHNVIKIESQMEREKTVRFFRESMSNRLNDDNSAIVIIMQRLHDGDVSGDILAREADYCHLMIPMRFEPMVYPSSADGEILEDPETGEPFEGNEDGELMTPREMAKYACGAARYHLYRCPSSLGHRYHPPRGPAAAFEAFWFAPESLVRPRPIRRDVVRQFITDP